MMEDINHTFRRGHASLSRSRVPGPAADRNPQTFVNIPDAKPSDFVKAAEHVYHRKAQPVRDRGACFGQSGCCGGWKSDDVGIKTHENAGLTIADEKTERAR